MYIDTVTFIFIVRSDNAIAFGLIRLCRREFAALRHHRCVTFAS